MTERERIEEWERQRYGSAANRWPKLTPPPTFRTVYYGPGEVVYIPWWGVAA